MKLKLVSGAFRVIQQVNGLGLFYCSYSSQGL